MISVEVARVDEIYSSLSGYDDITSFVSLNDNELGYDCDYRVSKRTTVNKKKSFFDKTRRGKSASMGGVEKPRRSADADLGKSFAKEEE